MANSSPIGVFDSGVGGISVLSALRREMPHENLLFRGDSANAPYGTKSPAEVLALSEASLLYLLERGCKAVVIACNTATAAAIDPLRKKYPAVPLIGVEPAIKPAALDFPGGNILLLATPLTVAQARVKALLARYEGMAHFIPVPLPGLVELIEAGHLSDAETSQYLAKMLAPYKKTPLDAAILGCTHFPHAKKAIAAELGGAVRLYDGGVGAAHHCRVLLEESGLLNPSAGRGETVLSNSLEAPYLTELMDQLFFAGERQNGVYDEN